MLGLTQQVGRHPHRVGAVVGDDRDLGGAGQQVDADPAEQLPLGLRDERVARADQHVHRSLTQQTEGHGAERLHAAEGEHPVGAGQVGAVQHRGVGAVLARRRRARHHRGHTGRLGDVDRHERAGEQREPAGRKVGPDAGDRHVPLAALHAGGELDLEVRQVLTLGGGEPVGALVAHLQGGADVRGQGVPRLLQLVAGDLQPAGPAVQLLGVGAHRVHALVLDFREHLGDALDHLRVALGGRAVDGRLLEPLEGREGLGFVVRDLHGEDARRASATGPEG
ncbi:hypothetical protein RKD40_000107 [Streptomyces ambofaciens]